MKKTIALLLSLVMVIGMVAFTAQTAATSKLDLYVCMTRTQLMTRTLLMLQTLHVKNSE